MGEGEISASGSRSAALRSPLDRRIVLVFYGAVAAALVVLCATVSQPILESYGFRQAQTALTAYWFVREGFALAYQTPILGYPWAVPFELPLFQAVVAGIASVIPYPLDSIGRTVSFVFFAATLVPVWVICRRLGLEPRVFFVFGSLYLLSPQYLFWGRTFMIEAPATFFAVATLAAALPFFAPGAISFWRAAGVVLLASIATTVKVTTGAPVLVVLMAALGVVALTRWRTSGTPYATTLLFRTLLLALPVLVALAWTHFADVVKAQNEIGKFLTSDAASLWTMGTARQRLSKAFLTDVIWRRSLNANAGGVLGLAVMSFFFISETRRTRIAIALCLSALFLLPLLLFTNLHIVHTYYQSANVIYLIFLLAMALVSLGDHSSGRLFVVAFVILILSNIANFAREYSRHVRQPISIENNTVLAAAKVVREQSAREKPILVYGHDWSSELPYYAERKALAVPDWYEKYDEPLTDSGRYFGEHRVGALVICPGTQAPNEDAVQRFLETHRPYRETVIHQCRIFVSVTVSPADPRSAAP
jgi:hypothetical protein